MKNKKNQKQPLIVRIESFLDRLGSPSPLKVILSSLLVSVLVIFVGATGTIVTNGLPIQFFGTILLFFILILQFYHKIERIWISVPLYIFLSLFIAISIDCIELTYYLNYLEEEEVTNKFTFFLEGYHYYLTLLFREPKAFFELYDNWIIYAWYPFCVLIGAGIPCCVKYSKKIKTSS